MDDAALQAESIGKENLEVIQTKLGFALLNDDGTIDIGDIFLCNQHLIILPYSRLTPEEPFFLIAAGGIGRELVMNAVIKAKLPGVYRNECVQVRDRYMGASLFERMKLHGDCLILAKDDVNEVIAEKWDEEVIIQTDNGDIAHVFWPLQAEYSGKELKLSLEMWLRNELQKDTDPLYTNPDVLGPLYLATALIRESDKEKVRKTVSVMGDNELYIDSFYDILKNNPKNIEPFGSKLKQRDSRFSKAIATKALSDIDEIGKGQPLLLVVSTIVTLISIYLLSTFETFETFEEQYGKPLVGDWEDILIFGAGFGAFLTIVLIVAMHDSKSSNSKAIKISSAFK